MIARAAALAFLCGCLHEEVQHCGDVVCPTDATCMVDHCIAHAAIVACDGEPDAQPCSYAQLAAGVCANGVCVPPGCGNGVVEPGEVCDGGGNCDADCQGVHGCPPIGTAPQFSRLLHQAIFQDCFEYSTSAAGTAVAMCNVDSSVALFEGPVDAPLLAIPGFGPQAGFVLEAAQLAPEGDELFVSYESTSSPVTSRIERFVAAADGSWTQSVDVTHPLLGFASMGTPSAGPRRHVLVVTMSTAIQELVVDSTGASSLIRSYTATDLGIGANSAPNLTADGLRAVFAGSTTTSSGVYYSDRAAIDDPLSPAISLAGLPFATDPFLTSDCARLYFSALSSVLYVRQI